VVTAVTEQLFEITDTHVWVKNTNDASVMATMNGIVAAFGETQFYNLFSDFMIDFLWDPSAMGITAAESNGCGYGVLTMGPTLTQPTNTFTGLMCTNTSGQVLVAQWYNFCMQNFTQAGMSTANATVMANWVVIPGQDPPWTWDATWGEHEIFLSTSPIFGDLAAAQKVPYGEVIDLPGPEVQASASGKWVATVPAEWLRLKNNDVHLFMRAVNGAHLWGGNSLISSDGMDSCGSIRTTVFEVDVTNHDYPDGTFPNNDAITYFRNAMRPYRVQEADGGYTADTEYNHISNNVAGPLKSNYSEPCPINLSAAEQEAQCVSPMEAVWGTAKLARLEAIKNTLDPLGLFYCYRCVGGPWGSVGGYPYY
jgi:hypothetical protein